MKGFRWISSRPLASARSSLAHRLPTLSLRRFLLSCLLLPSVRRSCGGSRLRHHPLLSICSPKVLQPQRQQLMTDLFHAGLRFAEGPPSSGTSSCSLCGRLVRLRLNTRFGVRVVCFTCFVLLVFSRLGARDACFPVESGAGENSDQPQKFRISFCSFFFFSRFFCCLFFVRSCRLHDGDGHVIGCVGEVCVRGSCASIGSGFWLPGLRDADLDLVRGSRGKAQGGGVVCDHESVIYGLEDVRKYDRARM